MKPFRLVAMAVLAVSCGSHIPDHTDCVRTVDAGPDPNHCDRVDNGVVSIAVTLSPSVANQNPGQLDAPLAYSGSDVSFTFDIATQGADADGGITALTSFNSYVTLSLQPGVITSITGVGGTTVYGRSVLLHNGTGTVTITFNRAFGETRFWAQDDGYVPVDPSVHPPQCANGIDDDSDGRIDYPADYGCAAPNDDTETGGSYAVGSSIPLLFDTPRIYDIYGGGASTPLLNARIDVTRGTLIVTRVNQNGLWVTDTSDTSCGGMACYNSVFAFNFNLPVGVRPCDRLDLLQGSVTTFASQVQLNQPSWHIAPGGLWVDQTDPGPCQIPDAVPIGPAALADPTNQLQPYEASIVRAAGLAWPTIIGPTNAACTNMMGTWTCTFSHGATNCDFNGDGKIEYTDPRESSCANACSAMAGCSEWTGWHRYSQLNVDFVAMPGGSRILYVDPSSAFSSFDPTNPPATPPAGFTITGTLAKAGPTYIIQARCDQDVVISGTPVAPSQSCVIPRTINEGM